MEELIDMSAEETPEESVEIQAQKLVKKTLESQGGRYRSDVITSLAAHLMAGGKPETYAERFAQMALQAEGLLPESVKE